MPPRLAPVLDERDLPLAELHAARLDGEVYTLGEGFAPIDEPEQAHLRARSLESLMRPRFIAERMTAAWVHGAVLRPPSVHQFCVSHSARARVEASRRFMLREVVIAPDELVGLGGVTVTSLMRTAIDLLRADSGGNDIEDDRVEDAVVQLLTMARSTLEQCRDVILARHKLAGKQRALRRVDALLAGARSPTS